MAPRSRRLAAFLLLRRYRRRQHRRFWVHSINEKRDSKGEYISLMRELREDEEKFFTYFRMVPEQFDELVSFLTPILKPEESPFRKPITVEEQLFITLR